MALRISDAPVHGLPRFRSVRLLLEPCLSLRSGCRGLRRIVWSGPHLLERGATRSLELARPLPFHRWKAFVAMLAVEFLQHEPAQPTCVGNTR